MITPPAIDAEAETQLLSIGEAFGNYVQQRGYRGICDVDCILSIKKALVVTESNFRRTGGNYLDYIVRQLREDNYCETTCWIDDVQDAVAVVSFETGVSALHSAGLFFNSDTGVGVILTTDTSWFDGKWRYLVLGRSIQQALLIEERLFDVLRM